MNTLEKLKQEDVISKTTTELQIREIIEHVEKYKDSPNLVQMAAELCSQVECCLPKTDRECLPSLRRGCMWSAFHQLRLSDKPQDNWKRFLVQISLPPRLLASVSDQCFQLVIDRMLKSMIEIRKKEQQPSMPVIQLSVREENVVYYMSGFVAFKLNKKYQQSSTDPEFKAKRKYFVWVLGGGGMKAEQQPLCDDTMEAYSRAWCELIDRGGLYKVKAEVCGLLMINNDPTLYGLIQQVHKLFLKIEMTRRYLSQDNLSALQCVDIFSVVSDDILKDTTILELWEAISKPTSSRQERYSLELLKAICRLWLTMRGFSFSGGCNSLLHKTFERGTRETLINKGTDKEA